MTSNLKYSRFEIQKVREADIRLFIPGASISRNGSQEIECPNCGKKKFSITRKKGMNFAKCWVCDFKLSGPLEAYAHFHNLNLERDFLKCVEGVAGEAHIVITPEKEVRAITASKIKTELRRSFCEQQLEGSGLTVDDVMVNAVDNNQEFQVSPFQKGTMGPGFMPDLKGDDMLIHYFDLYGRPVQYIPKGGKTLRKYVRVRYANPELHVAPDGSTMKYQSPAGASAQVYIPEKVRQMYRQNRSIDVLFLQEGEKKAEKACKHGMISLGLQGISNIGSKEHGIIQAIQEVVQKCRVRHVVMVMDSDWNCLSRSLTVGEAVDKRPISFSAAVIKFKRYIETFHNSLHLDVDVWWGHVNENEAGEKGVDDLLVGSLKGREPELMADIDRTMHTHNGVGHLLNIHKITTLSDAKIREFWLLNDHQAFFEAHKGRLNDLSMFRLGGVCYKVENGAIAPVSRYSSDVDIFSIEEDSKERKKVSLNYTETFRFLSASGFYRLRNSEEDGSGYEFIHIDNGIVCRTTPCELRDFILNYIMSSVKAPLVHEFFYSKLDVLLPDKKLERLEVRPETFNRFESNIQRTYFNNGQVEITKDSIRPNLPITDVWRSRIVPRNFKRVQIIKTLEPISGGFTWELTDEGKECEFLQYLINASNNYFTHDAPRETTEEETYEWIQHIVNKITAIGFLLSDWKYPSDRQAVVIQDHRISEVGQAWGGAGKSVLGTALSKITPQFFINGQDFSATDEFILSGVTKATRNIFIDDVKTNFDFKTVFNWITGPMPINPKGKERYTLPVETSPKLLVTTNHAIKNADEGSVKRRIAYVEFSSWYNQDHALIDDFHHMFFDDWDEHQWNLFDNFMAECVMYYFRSFDQVWYREGRGVVPPPMRNIELRTLRQSMGETFLAWAEEYFDPTGINLNERRERKEIWNSFLEYAGGPAGHGVTRSNIRRKVEAYCKFKGYDFNISKPNKEGFCCNDWKATHPDESFLGGDDKSGGKEFITVYSAEFEKEKKPF